MRCLLLLSLILFSQFHKVHGQSSACLPEGKIFGSQSQIDSFKFHYPGCTVIEGSLTIESAEIENLEGLNVLTRIDGTLWVNENDNLKSLSGLDFIDSVGGNVILMTNPKLKDLQGLGSLQWIGGYFEVWDNDSLTSLIGMETLSRIDKKFDLRHNNELLSMEGFNVDTIFDYVSIYNNPKLLELNLRSLQYLGENLGISTNYSLKDLSSIELDTLHSLFLANNHSLEDLTGLDSLRHIEEDFTIWETSLHSLSGAHNLRTIGGDLGIFYIDSLKTLGNLQLLSVGGHFQIMGNINLQDIESLRSLVDFKNLTIEENNSLTSLRGFTIDSINSLRIVSNPKLTDLKGLDSVIYARQLHIYDNDGLISLTGIENLASANDLGIGGNNNLESISILKIKSISNSFYIGGDSKLTGDFGLDSLSHVKYLNISNNPILNNLRGLGTVRKLAGLDIDGNPLLRNLEGLDSITEIKALEITDSYLISLKGIDQINSDSIQYLQITNSQELYKCSVQSICEYLSRGEYAYIEENSTGCNSIEEITDNCIVSSIEEEPSAFIQLVPNPATDHVVIKGLEVFDIKIIDNHGRLLYPEFHGNAMDISSFASGCYFIFIYDGEQCVVQKLIKQ